jgi:hypothetical protein
LSYISKAERKRLGDAARAIIEEGCGLAQFALVDISDPTALTGLAPIHLSAIRQWTDAIWAGGRCRCLLCDDIEFTSTGTHAPHAMAITCAASGAAMALVNAICSGCAARADLMDAALEKLKEVFPDSRTVDRANVHFDGGGA